MIDLATEDWFIFSEARSKLPMRPSRWTVWRWHRYGKKLPNGKVVKLEAKKTTYGRATSIQAYYRFQEAIAASELGVARRCIR